MDKFLVGFLLILFLAVLVVIGVTLTFVFQGEKKLHRFKKEGLDRLKYDENTWSFYSELEDGEKRKKSQKVLNLNIRKTSDYYVEDNKLIVRPLNYNFEDLEVSGYTHSFEDPIIVNKVVVGEKEIVPKNLVLLFGFTVFFKENKTDFVTIWLDGDFHHYRKDGSLICEGLFPFAEGDTSKNPIRLNLPIGVFFHKSVSKTGKYLTKREYPEDLNEEKHYKNREKLENRLNKFKILTLNEDNSILENDTNEYQVFEYYDLHGPGFLSFQFNTKTRCVEIKYDERTVWKYNERKYGENFPDKVYYDYQRKTIEVTKFNVWLNLYKFYSKEGVFKLQLFTKLLTYEEHPECVRIVTRESSSDSFGVSINDFTKFKAYNHNGFYVYKFNKEHRCVEVRYHDETLWKYNYDEYGEYYPEKLFYNPETEDIRVFGGSWTNIYQYDFVRDEYKFNYYEKKLYPFDHPQALRIVTVDVSNSNKTFKKDYSGFDTSKSPKRFENEYSHFDAYNENGLFVYRINYGYKCVEVSYGGELVWSLDSSSTGAKCPSAVHFNPLTKGVKVI